MPFNLSELLINIQVDYLLIDFHVDELFNNIQVDELLVNENI